ncbi:MAG: ABC transporter permease [Microscillaceae bacterium]|nr:ABC transporter permease [Microscillaceae bacterium]
MKFLRLIWESFLFALKALRSNLLRTTLSLAGVSVGIFAIISVFTMVDSLERTIRKDMSFIGSDVMYVQKFPWGFGGGEYPWWKYFQRKPNTISDFKFLKKNLKNAQGVCLMAFRGNITAKHSNNSMQGLLLMGTSYDLNIVRDVIIDQGRYFTLQEVESARDVAVIGAEIAEVLFPNRYAIGKNISIRGLKYTIIGVMEKEGKTLFGDNPNDTRIIVPYGSFSKLFLLGRKGIEPSIAVKGFPEDEGLNELEGEIKGLLRPKRGLRPTQEDDFALNRTQSFSDAITSLFAVISFAGSIIGGFSILVGGFGIANIMFVSVKERTNLIGIQKSLGARNYFILFQFLFESIFLSLIGGLVGLGLVYLITFIPLGSLELILTFKNSLIGLIIASCIGVLFGIIPAYVAARMNPVEAIRQG